MSDDELEDLTAKALAERGDLLPTTEDDVARVEAEGVEFDGELPDSLREFDAARTASARTSSTDAPPARSTRVVDLAERRATPWLGYGVAATLGAAAASVFFLVRTPPPDPGPAGTLSAEPADASPAPPERPIRVEVEDECPKRCCAGSRCGAAEGELRECSSGRTCIACSVADLSDSRYRLRVSALALTAAGVAKRESQGPLELCASAGGSNLACVPAHADSGSKDVWQDVGLLVSGQDLIAGLELRVRARGNEASWAEWKNPVRVTPTVLCRGLALKPRIAEETIGTVSVFLRDAYFVELGRAQSPGDVRKLAGRIELEGASLEIYETSAEASKRFALVVGPMSQPRAERMRWHLLEAGAAARVSVGSDHLGESQRLP